MRCKSALHGALKALYVEEMMHTHYYKRKEEHLEERKNMRNIKEIFNTFLLSFISIIQYKSKEILDKFKLLWRKKDVTSNKKKEDDKRKKRKGNESGERKVDSQGKT